MDHTESQTPWSSNLLLSVNSLNCGRFLWPTSVADADIIFCSCGVYLSSSFFFLLFSSPILSGRRLDVYHTSTHDVALVRISNSGVKCAASGSLKIPDAKNSPKFKIRHLRTIAQGCRAISLQLKHVSTIGKKLF